MMKCPVCRATYRPPASSECHAGKPCRRCGADLDPLIKLHDHAIAYHRQAIVYFTMGDLQSAIKENTKAIKLHSQEPAFHAFAGQLYALQGEFNSALRAWQLARRLDPQNSVASTCLGLWIEMTSHDD